MRFTKDQLEVLGKFVYDSTEVMVTVNTSLDKVVQLATELNVTSKRISQWITNKKRILKPDLFKRAGFQACGLQGLPYELNVPANAKPRRSRKRGSPDAHSPININASVNQTDDSIRCMMANTLNFKDAGMPNLEQEKTEDSSISELWEPYNAAPPLKKMKMENLPSDGNIAEQFRDTQNVDGSLIKSEAGGGEMMESFQSAIEDDFPMPFMRVNPSGEVNTPLYSPSNNFNSMAKSNPPQDIVSFDEATTEVPNTVLYPSFLGGLHNSNPSSAPETPLPRVQPKLEIRTPLGRPPPCVAGVEEPMDFGFLHQLSCKTEPSSLLQRSKPRSKSRGIPAARAKSAAGGGRKKVH